MGEDEAYPPSTVIDEYDDDPTQSKDKEVVEGAYADGRLPEMTYLSKSFDLPGGPPGTPARFVWQVMDQDEPTRLEFDGSEWTIYESPKGRIQVKLLVAGEPGHVTRFWLQRLDRSGKHPKAKDVISLSHAEARRLVELLKNLDRIPVEGASGQRVADDLVRELFNSPESLVQLYRRDREQFMRLISDDEAARDVVALRRRRTEVARFRRLLDDPDHFAEAQEGAPGRRPERVWQDFFEENPWILGTGLSGQLFTSWDEDKLEQVVGGASIVQEGKRVDALMRTSGVVRWLTFSEFKTHETALLAGRYRSGAWPPSADLVAGISQAHDTVHRAMREIGEALPKRAPDGSELPDDLSYLFRPRSYLVVGHLRQLLGEDGGPHLEKIRSFESFRRSLSDPEIVTYDELLARAEWMVSTEQAAQDTDEDTDA